MANVRFIKTTKEKHLNRAVYDPNALYFCEDTQEIFKGQYPYTEGIKVIPTKADLPSFPNAADGVVYFIAETKSGYIMSPDRTEWLQTIYAPVTDAYEIPESEMYSTVTTVGAVRDIEAKIYKTIDERIANIPGADIDLSDYVKQEDITDFATKEFVQAKIAEAELADQDVDLSAYYTKSETEAAIASAVDAIEVPDISGLATKEELEAVQNVAGSNSVKLMQLDSDLVDINNQLDNIQTTYATKDEVAAVEAKIDSIVIPEVPTKVSELENDAGYITAADITETDLSNYYNKTETESLIAEAVEAIEHPTVDLEGYATEEWVNAQGFLKEHQDLSEYAKKSDIPQPELFVVDYNAPDFAAALEAYNNGKLLLLTNAAPDSNGYAVMNYVRDDLITFTKFLMSRSETYGAFNTYYLHSDNTWELAKEVKLNKVEAVADAGNNINGLVIGKNTYDFDHFATTEAVNQITENIQNTYVTNETLEQKNYVTEQYVTNNYITQEAANETYVTTEKVTEVVETQVNEVVTKEIETKVETVIQEKVDTGEIVVKKAETISYDTWGE